MTPAMGAKTQWRWRWSGRVLAAAASAIFALGLAELGATALHRGAYPYLNVFDANAQFGVVLTPLASTRVRSRQGQLTEIATNSWGFRGPEISPPGLGDRRVMLLGDSQVLGYGVPYPAVMGARLTDGLPATVLNAAVPSWGPWESAWALETWGPRFRPTHVVFFANAANDWAELTPNAQRMSAQDGWAKAATFDPVSDFPLRRFLLGRSHLVLAVRQLRHAMGGPPLPVAHLPLQLRRDLPRLSQGTEGFRSLLGPALAHAAATCVRLGCTLVAAALPVDVQVSPAEWKKYRVSAQDMVGTETLLDDFLEDARALNLPTVNLLPPLRAAEPGAFLEDDYHLSATGHAVVAQALTPLLQPSLQVAR